MKWVSARRSSSRHEHHLFTSRLKDRDVRHAMLNLIKFDVLFGGGTSVSTFGANYSVLDVLMEECEKKIKIVRFRQTIPLGWLNVMQDPQGWRNAMTVALAAHGRRIQQFNGEWIQTCMLDGSNNYGLVAVRNACGVMRLDSTHTGVPSRYKSCNWARLTSPRFEKICAGSLLWVIIANALYQCITCGETYLVIQS